MKLVVKKLCSLKRNKTEKLSLNFDLKVAMSSQDARWREAVHRTSIVPALRKDRDREQEGRERMREGEERES